MDVEDAVAVAPGVDLAAWADGFSDMFALVAGEFAQAPSRLRARAYLLGLLSQTERKNGWWLADFAGDSSPDGMQRLLNFYAWSADAVRDAARDYVVAGMLKNIWPIWSLGS
jgi:SRSO17 transposase